MYGAYLMRFCEYRANPQIFENDQATIRSREISLTLIILQSQSQLKAIYKDNADTIVGNCDTTLSWAARRKTTLKRNIGNFREKKR